MEAVEALKKTIHVTRELHSVVRTMKVLAGLNIRVYERAAHAIAEYNNTVERGLQVALERMGEPVLSSRASPDRKLGVIVFGSDQGMCGQLNDLIVDHALQALARFPLNRLNQTALAVGFRAGARLEDSGRTVEATLDVPGSPAGITGTVHEVLRIIEDWHSKRGIEMVVLFYCRLISGVAYRARGIRILPVDAQWIRNVKARRWPSKVIPMYRMETERLFQSLIREYLFVSFFRAFAESLASENASRLASMQVAERNIEDRLKELTSEFSQSRQASITSELLDIVSAFEALKGKRVD
jgi:F-type H+-transporting ATPase subunit gamma